LIEDRTGAGACVPMVYAAVAILLGVNPVFHALAFKLVVEEITIGVEYIEEVSVGVVPSSV